MAHALRYNQSDAALESNLQLIDCHLPNPVHKSKYRFLKHFQIPRPIKHYYCYDCAIVLSFQNSTITVCPSCETEFRKSAMDHNGHYFLSTSIKDQLIEVIISKAFTYYRKIDKKVKDVINSNLYKYLQQQGIVGKNDISLTWNTDGISLFKSSKKSTWSILARINELPFRISKDNIILCALWHDKRKPKMKMFLKPFADEMLDLYNNGFKCSPYMSDVEITIKVHAILCSVDTIARPTIQNLIQFNGEFGCPYCLQKGEILSETAGTARVYSKCESEERTVDQHKEHIRLATEENKPVIGVKGPSVVEDIPNLCTLRSYPPDYMHAWLLGIVKTIVRAWFDSSNHKEPWYLGLHLEEINKRLLDILPPCEVTRTPQNIDNKLKAAEWRNFLLYYCIVVLLGILPNKYYKHWLLFVRGAHILLKAKRTEQEIQSAEEYLTEFHNGIEDLYGKQYMTFNVHTLKHVIKYVRYFESLWAWSTFCFESYNGVIKRLYHGTQCIADQIFKSYFRLKLIKKQRHVFSREECSEEARSCFIKLMNECRIKNCIEYNDDLRLFYCRSYQLSDLERNLLEIYFEDVVVNVSRCDRFVHKSILFHSIDYKRLQKRNNSCFITEDKRIFIVDKVIRLKLESSDVDKVVIVARKIQILNEQLRRHIDAPNFVFVGRRTTDLGILDASSINKKCICMPHGEEKVVVVPLVNNIEID